MDLRMIFPVPDIMNARRVLAVQPHYDDNDIAAGGLLARLAESGAELFYLTVTDDLVGVTDTTLGDTEASIRLRRDQFCAGEIIGVTGQYWLGYPDAGDYSYIAMRNRVIEHVRLLKPDVLVSCDPWLPYEAHRDHVNTGRAVAEASYLHGLKRLKTIPEVDQAYEPYEIRAVVLYLSHAPNTTIDIGPTREKKHRALDCYTAQFDPGGMLRLHRTLELAERFQAQGQGFEFAEMFKIVTPGMLHANPYTTNL